MPCIDICNARNQQVSYSMNGATMATYTYNPDGLRRSKHVLLTLEQRFIWSGGSMVYECELLYPNNGTVYVYGINLISSRNNSGNDIFYLYNAHGDVVQLVDGTGTIVQTYNYDAFGVEYDVDVDYDNPFRYAGLYYDTETGTYYLRARYYNPSIGRFTQQDRRRFGHVYYPLTLNLYTYCINNPIMFYDPSGHYISSREQIIDSIYGLTGDPDWASSYTSEAWERMINALMEDREYMGLEPDEKMDRILVLLNSPTPKSVLAPALEIINKIESTVNNTDEQKVLDADYTAFYKGKLVIKLPIGTNAASFGVIFIGNDVKHRSDAVKTLQHEYGHTVQMEEYGVFKYTMYVAIPSLSFNLLDRLGISPHDYYYSYPWEHQADIYGGVNRIYKPWAGKVNGIYGSIVKMLPF